MTKPNAGCLPAVSLFYREGGSDKEYHAGVQASGDGYVVNCSWGRRGSTLQTGTKTQYPVSLDDATRIFEKIVKEKEGKGYKRKQDAAAFIKEHVIIVPVGFEKPAVQPERPLPQLLNPLPEEQLAGFVARMGGQWCAQEKFDGKRIILSKEETVVQAFNRTGKECGIASEIVEHAKTLLGNFVLDGEAIGPDYYAFDLLKCGRADHRDKSYGTRHRFLRTLLGHPNGWPIHPVPIYTGVQAVTKFIAELKAKNAEGVVFKDLLAPYTAGRPNSGGPQLKCKFCATCSAIVVAQNEQRSVAVALYINPNEGLTIGNVTIPPNHTLPPVGAVVEIRYLYAYKGGALYQPVYLGERDDVQAADCTVEKQALKYKPDVQEEA